MKVRFRSPKFWSLGNIGVPHFIINPYDVLLFLQMSFSLLDDVLTGVCYVCWTFSPQHGGQTVILLVYKPIYIVCIYTCIYIYICTCLTLDIQYPSTIEKLCVKKLSYCLGALHCMLASPTIHITARPVCGPKRAHGAGSTTSKRTIPRLGK